MSTTIDSLNIQVSTNAAGAAQNIDRLASSLGKLKSNSKLTVVINNLTRLSQALDGLKGSDSAVGNLEKLESAFSGLANLPKLSGLSGAINSLKKIPDIVNSLDVATLEKFRRQMDKLADALGPLAKRIEAVGKGFSKLPNRVSSTVTATNRMASAQRNLGKSLDTTQVNLMATIENYEHLFSVMHMVMDAVSGFMAQAIEWDGIQFRFGRAFGEDAEEVYNYVLKINDVLGINTQEFMQYSSLYGSLLSGFGMAQKKVTTISVGLTELSYDIWAAYNDRFKTLEDASEAVRSAITGEIEPIRNAGIALTEASLQEYMKSVGMTTVSIEKLSEAQKSEVRYAAMVNAAMNQGIIGTYAREMNTAEGAVRSLSQSFKTLTQALGSLFIPILQLTIPYLTAFVELLTEAIMAVAKLFNIPMFEIDWGNPTKGLGDVAGGATDVASGLNDAADAAKALKDYTMGFDELNVISPDSGSGSNGPGGGAGGAGDSGWGDGLDLSKVWDDSIFEQASKRVDELKEKIKASLEEWKTEIAIISAALAALTVAKMLSSMSDFLRLGEGVVAALEKIQKIASTVIVITLQFALQKMFFEKFMGDDGSFWDYVQALLVGAGSSWILYKMWGPGGLVIGLGVTAVASLSAIIENGGINSAESAIVALTGLGTAVGALTYGWKLLAKTDVGAFFRLLREGEPLIDTFKAAFPSLANGIAKVSGWFSKITPLVKGFVTGLPGTEMATIAAVVTAIASAAYFLYKNWDKVTEAVKNFFKNSIAPKLEQIGEHFEDIKETLGPVGDAFGKFVKSVKDFFEDIDWSKFDWIGKIFETLGGIITSTVMGVILGAFKALVSAVEGVIQTISGIVKIVSGVVKTIVSIVTKGEIGDAWKEVVDGIVDVVSGLWDATVGAIDEFVNGVIEWFEELFDVLVGHSIVPDLIDEIVDWFLSLPKKILGPIKDFCNNVIQKFKDMWSSTKSWFNSNVAPKFTTEYWKKKFDVIRSAISTKLSEVRTSMSEKWEAIKTWFKNNIAPKFTVEYWKSKFDSIRSALVTKLNEAWTAVKNFFSVSEWKKKVTEAVNTIKNNFKLPSFPRIKLSVEWDTNVGKLKTAVYQALGLSGWPTLKWSTYAMGGFPSMGEMFIAREAGPELVGRIGNKTTVANNDQIVDAVSQGVYQAVMSAMGNNQSGGSQPIVINLDGKQIYSSVKKREAQRGMTLMGNQLGYTY